MSSTSFQKIRLGCDLCQIAAMEKALRDGSKVTERLFHAQELNDAMDRSNPAQHLAGIFAAKEALGKALKQPQLLGKYHKEVTILHREDGTPTLTLSDRLTQDLSHRGIQVMDLSISHDGEYALAVVLIGETPPLQCHKCLLTLEYLKSQRITEDLIRVEGLEGSRFLCPVCAKGW